MSDPMKAQTWERIAEDRDQGRLVESTERMRVPDGWLYRVVLFGRDETARHIGLCFVPGGPVMP